jgi:hypothetical protein
MFTNVRIIPVAFMQNLFWTFEGGIIEVLGILFLFL